MKSLLWHFGKLLQLLGLIAAPYALIIGMNTENPTLELKILLSAVSSFIVGLIFVKSTSSSA
jgi:hypothetical protein